MRPQLGLGVGLVALGVVLLLGQLDVIDAGEVIGSWWPLIIIAIGAMQLVERPQAPTGPLIVIAVGLLLLATRLDLLPDRVWQYVWPVGLILVGLMFVLRRGPGAAADSDPAEVISASAFFSGTAVVSTAAALRGGSATAAFGGVKLDLRQAHLDPAGATVSASALCGGVEVLVPRGWRVVTSGTPIFGGLDNKADAAPDANAPTLRIEATVLLGGIEVKHDK